MSDSKHYYHGDRVMEFIEEFELDFRLGNVVKYVARCGKKPDQEELKELQKALWYLCRFIAVEYKDEGFETIQKVVHDINTVLAHRPKFGDAYRKYVLGNFDKIDWAVDHEKEFTSFLSMEPVKPEDKYKYDDMETLNFIIDTIRPWPSGTVFSSYSFYEEEWTKYAGISFQPENKFKNHLELGEFLRYVLSEGILTGFECTGKKSQPNNVWCNLWYEFKRRYDSATINHSNLPEKSETPIPQEEQTQNQ